MSAASRKGALSRHPALNRMPRDFLMGAAAPIGFPCNGNLKGL